MLKDTDKARPLEIVLTVSQLTDFDPLPPRKRFWDYFPRTAGWLRERYNWPAVTPYMAWAITVIFAARLLKGLWKLRMEETEALVNTVPNKGWN